MKENITSTYFLVLEGKQAYDHSLSPAPEQHLSNHSLAAVTRHSRPAKLWVYIENTKTWSKKVKNVSNSAFICSTVA